MNLDAYMDDFGRDLKRVAAKRRARRRVARFLLPAVPALAVAFAVIPRGGDVDAVAAARVVLAPNGRDRPHEDRAQGGRLASCSRSSSGTPPTPSRWRYRRRGLGGRRAGQETMFPQRPGSGPTTPVATS